MYLYILMLHISGVQYALSHHLFSRGVTELVKRALCRFGNEIQTHRPVLTQNTCTFATLIKQTQAYLF